MWTSRRGTSCSLQPTCVPSLGLQTGETHGRQPTRSPGACALLFPVRGGLCVEALWAVACSDTCCGLQVNGVALHDAEHHQAVEALRGAGATVHMRLWRERMVEPENAVTVTPLRPEDDYSPRERRLVGLRLPLPETPGPLRQRHVACLVRSEKGLGFSIAGGKGSTPYRAGDGVSGQGLGGNHSCKPRLRCCSAHLPAPLPTGHLHLPHR